MTPKGMCPQATTIVNTTLPMTTGMPGRDNLLGIVKNGWIVFINCGRYEFHEWTDL